MVDRWERLNNSRYSSSEWRPKPFANVERGPYNNPNIGSSEFSNDARAAYYNALCWALSGDEVHAKKAAEILDAWSKTLKSIRNHDARLLIGMSGYHFCVGAELLKHTWDKWPEGEQSRFEAMLKNIWYPVIKDFYPTANGNWDASMLQVMIAMGVFLDDQEMFDRAKTITCKAKATERSATISWNPGSVRSRVAIRPILRWDWNSWRILARPRGSRSRSLWSVGQSAA